MIFVLNIFFNDHSVFNTIFKVVRMNFDDHFWALVSFHATAYHSIGIVPDLDVSRKSGADSCGNPPVN